MLAVACGGGTPTTPVVAPTEVSDEEAWSAFCRDLAPIFTERTGLGWDDDSLATLESDADLFERAGDAETSAAVRTLVAALRDASVASQVNVYFADPIDRELVAEVMGELRANENVVEVWFQSKAAAYETFVRMFADQPDLIEAAEPSALPASVRAVLAPGIDGDPIAARYLGRQGVRNAVAEAPDPELERALAATGFIGDACMAEG